MKMDKNTENLKTEINSLREQNRQLAKQNNDLRKELENINNSNGMKVLRKYYKIRDFLLPVNSKRRVLIKSIFKFARNFRHNLKLLNKKNLMLVLSYLKRGEFKLLLGKVDRKLSFIEGDIINSTDKKFLYNVLLQTKHEICINKNMVIDILIPIYNAYEYTVKCIHSVLENTDVPYNLILLNDCSTDERISLFINELRDVRAKNLLEIIVIEHKSNLGFVKNINYGMEITKNNIVILNTDTEVPENWLSRLIYPYCKDDKVCTVTPFSNCATICSFPVFCEDNVLPDGLTVTEIDNIFKEYAANNFYEIPTGVGFCMFMNRNTINEIGMFDYVTFEKGYGEENDWCRRAKKKGYKNVAISNLFVYHKHGASFGEIIDKSKAERIRDNLVKLNKKHPEYDLEVQKFISEDPNKYQRNLLDIAVQLKTMKYKKVVLFINHSMGGGATVYLENLIRDNAHDTFAIVMNMSPDQRTISLNSSVFNDVYFDLDSMDKYTFKALLNLMNIKEIFINELVSYPLPKMIEFILESGIPYTYFIHDFFCICPSLNLIGKNKMYCYVSDVRTCSLCIKDNDYRYMSNIDNYYLNNIELWRDCFSRLLLGADNVIAPSNSTAEIIKKIYPEVDIIVQEHNINIPIKNTYNKEFCLQKKVRIGIVGAISYIKGYGVLYEMIKKVRQNRDNIEFVVIGYTEVESEKYKSEDNVFTLTGKYDNKKISEILAQYNISFVMLPNVCPETFSYTASEAILSGYPLLTFDIGAAPERIRRYDCGWCVEDICCDAMYEKCVYLSNHREEILAKANNCPKISNKY